MQKNGGKERREGCFEEKDAGVVPKEGSDTNTGEVGCDIQARREGLGGRLGGGTVKNRPIR